MYQRLLIDTFCLLQDLLCVYCKKVLGRPYELRRHYGRCKIVQHLLETNPNSLELKVRVDASHFKSILEREKVDRKRKQELGEEEGGKRKDERPVFICGVCF